MGGRDGSTLLEEEELAPRPTVKKLGGQLSAVVVSCKRFVGTSTQRFLKSVGVTGTKLKRALKDLAEEAEQGRYWLWPRRKIWGKDGC